MWTRRGRVHKCARSGHSARHGHRAGLRRNQTVALALRHRCGEVCGMPNIVDKYEIPDPALLSPDAQRGMRPSAPLIAFHPLPISASDVLGKVVQEVSDCVGTYGMGGPGFFGLRLGREWLVVAVRGAAEWMTARGRNVGDSFHDNYGRPRPWLADWISENPDELSPHLLGGTISSIAVEKHSMKIELDNGFDLTIAEAPDDRPIFEGSKEARRFTTSDDLRRAVFLAPTTEIWV